MDGIGIIGMIFGMAALYRVYKLEKVLKEKEKSNRKNNFQ